MHLTIDTVKIRKLNFDTSLNDVKTMMSLYGELTSVKTGRPHIEYEVLKRAGIILLVTAWESFIESVILQEFEDKLAKVKKSSEVQSAFNSFANSWFSKLANKKITPNELESLTGDGWKSLLLKMCENEIAVFNSPNYDNIDQLFKKYLTVSAEQVLRVPGYNKMWIRTNLNILIIYRGNLVHRSKQMFAPSRGVPKLKVIKAIRLISGCAESIEKYFQKGKQ